MIASPKIKQIGIVQTQLSVTHNTCPTCDELRELCGELWKFHRQYGLNLTDKDYADGFNKLEARLKKAGVIE